jgi:Zn-dependent alcohol dehydrogenase
LRGVDKGSFTTGAGYVKAVGSKVTKQFEVGDPVLLSFDHCTKCTQCRTGHPGYCDLFSPLNVGGEAATFKGADGDVTGQFFGQSSFASLTAVKETSLVNVKGLIKDEDELKLFAPMGCGFQTGAGTVVNLAAATSEDSVVVLGLGGVGSAAILVGQRFDSRCYGKDYLLTDGRRRR